MKKDAKCLRCGHEWTKRTDNPIRCPKCTIRSWRGEVVKPYIRKNKSERREIPKKDSQVISFD